MGGKQKPKEETKLYQRRQAATLRKQEKNAAVKRRRVVEREAKKAAVAQLAEETFGPGGLTPARKEALIAVAVGPDVQGDVDITSPIALRMFVKKARRRFTELAESYVNTHHNAVKAALANGDYDTAARHSEWAMENLGGKEEGRVVDAPSKAAAPQYPTIPIAVGVNLGGVPHKQD